jgi:hypothetical protein
MTATNTLSKPELLARIDEAWQNFNTYVNSVTAQQLSQPTDPAGWTAKDHVTHLAVWVDGINGVMEGGSRRERMGINENMWERWDYDEINGSIQQRYRHLSAPETVQMLRDAHQRLVANIQSFSEEALRRSFRSYQPDTRRTDALIDAIVGNTIDHYPEHQAWMATIIRRAELDATDPDKVTVDQLLTRIEIAWNDLNSFLSHLSAEQLTTPTDAGGWTVKDHIIHLAVWEDGIRALLQKQSRREAMGISEDLWGNGSADDYNAVIQPRYKDMPLDEVITVSGDIHQRLVDTLRSMSNEDLQRPYNHYAPDSDRDAPVLNWIAGNTFGHYEEHLPWIRAIVGKP